jgi:alpha-amylase
MNISRRQYISLWLVSAIFLLSCEGTEKSNVVAWPHGVKYEIFVQSFADGDNDGKGDFKGLTSRLDYLSDLGINGIWLMPIMNSPTYHKYDVTDYKSIHPDYGSVDDFKKFVDEAHKRNIKVIVDLILNHTGADHPWFQAAMKDKGSPYRDYYVWAKKDSIQAQISKKSTSLDSDNITQWHPVNGDTLSEHYYGFFFGGMPDLNFDNAMVKKEFVDIGNFWLKDLKVDGFRLDAAKHIFPTERAADNHAFWQEFRTSMESIKPDVYLVGEVWSKAEDVAPYLGGLPALFNFDMGYAITQVVSAGRDTVDLIGKYKMINDFYKSVTTEFLDATFLKNHDQNRILSELGGNVSKMRVAAGILLTLPGTPYLYYGEEIGMLGVKPDEYIREPFVWDVDTTDEVQTYWEQPKYSTAQTVVPLKRQVNDPLSIYNFYKTLIHYRNSSKALTFGDIEPTEFRITEVISFKRHYDDEQLLILNNISDVEVTIQLTGKESAFDDVAYDSNGTSELTEDGLRLPAFSTVILK